MNSVFAKALVLVFLVSLPSCGGSSSSPETTAQFLNSLVRDTGAPFTAKLELGGASIDSNTGKWSAKKNVECGVFDAVVRYDSAVLLTQLGVEVSCETNNKYEVKEENGGRILVHSTGG